MARTPDPGRGPPFQGILLLSALGLVALLQPASGTKVREITIVLTPRNYIHPRDRPGFFCGLESKIDDKRLLAELNSNYLLNLLDNTNDPSPGYPTSVFQVASFDAKGDLYRFPRPCIGGCLGVFSLILIPPSRECYGNLFSDASVIGEDYYVVFLGQSIPEEAITKFQGEAENLKALYDGEMPKLCGTRTFMRSNVAKSFTESITSIFNFHLNNQTRTIGDPSLKCMHSNETENSLAYSSYFEYSSTNFQFETNTVTAIEEEGFMETKINRQSTGKAGVAFIETTLEAQAGGAVANRSDLVPFNGPVYFKQGNNTASFFTQIKIDNQPESDEAFTQSLKSIVKGRAKRMGAPFTSGKIGDQDVPMVANDDVVKVMTIPVGQGDSTMIECPNGWITMIDMGSMHEIVEKDRFSEHVLNYLKTSNKNRQRRTLRHIFLTHPDADHINYGHWKTTTKTKTNTKTKTKTKPKTKTKSVIKTQTKTKTKTKPKTKTTHAGLLTKITSADGRKFKVHIGNKDNWSKKPSADELLKYVERSKHLDIVSHQAPFTHVPLCQDDSNLEVYMEIIASDIGMSANSQSMVMKLHAYGNTMLFLGDIEDDTAENLKTDGRKALTELIQKPEIDLESDVVMIPHHGSSENGNGETNFYDKVNARYAVISSHIGNTHDHPRQKTIHAYCQKVGDGTTKYMDACDIPCGFNYEYPKDPTAKASWKYICPNGIITSWGPMKTLNWDMTAKEQYGLSRRTMYESYNCPGGKIFQTTKFGQQYADNALKLMASMVVTDLSRNGITMKDVKLDLQEDNKGTVRYVPPLNENMFQKAYAAKKD